MRTQKFQNPHISDLYYYGINSEARFALFISLRFSEFLWASQKKAGTKREFYAASQIFSEILREIEREKRASGSAVTPKDSTIQFMQKISISQMPFLMYNALLVKFYHLPNNVYTRSTSSNFPVLTAKSPIYRYNYWKEITHTLSKRFQVKWYFDICWPILDARTQQQLSKQRHTYHFTNNNNKLTKKWQKFCLFIPLFLFTMRVVAQVPRPQNVHKNK